MERSYEIAKYECSLFSLQLQEKNRFNFRKARWNDFRAELDSEIIDLASTTENDETFVNIVKKVSRNHNPRDCRTEYITGLSSELT